MMGGGQTVSFEEALVRCHDYMWMDLGLDLIGSSDMYHDFRIWFASVYLQGLYESPEQVWGRFNTEVIEPVYKISVPAVSETRSC